MARQLSSLAINAIAKRDLKMKRTIYINSVDRTSFLMSATRSFDKTYGSASASITLHNPNGIFSDDGIYEINVGDVVELIYQYEGDTISYPCFYGQVSQRGILKSATTNEITLTCLDYIKMLDQWDIELLIEGEKIQIENETLTPNYLPSPNEMFAQTFNFANDDIATNPTPVLQIRDRLHENNDPQYDGFEIYYHSGQVRFGSPINALDNYDVVAKTYSCYTSGVFVEDAIEQILTQPNGYGKYLFDEPNAQAVIDNHLTETYYNVTGLTQDTLTPNYSATTTFIKTRLTDDYYGATAPIIHYKFSDDTNNDEVVDSSGNYMGHLLDGDVYMQTVLITNVAGKINRDFNFNASTWNINCGDVTELNDCRRATFTFWLSLDDFSGGVPTKQIIFKKSNELAVAKSEFKFYVSASDSLIFETTNQDISLVATLPNFSSIITEGTYYHYKLALDFTKSASSDKIKLYINNVLQTLTFSGFNLPSRLPNLPASNFYIGDKTESIAGFLDDFRFYNFIVPNSYSDLIYNSGNGTEDAIEVTYLSVESTEGFVEPESGETQEADINGDIFTYTSLDDTHLYGIPISGASSLSYHPSGAYVTFASSRDTGNVWYLKYSNIITDMTTDDFNLPSGVTVTYFDKRYGRIYLSEPISVASVVTTNVNYSFKTLQASGIEINRIRFTQRDTENRFEAINQLRDWVAPNYIIRTIGDRKIWSSFLTQRPIEDFDLNLKTDIRYLEDTDLYTRVLLYGKNNNPTNLMFSDGVDFVTTNEEYKGYAANSQLTYIGAEGGTPVIPDGADETYRQWITDMVSHPQETGYYLYATGIPGVGHITVQDVVPTVTIDTFAIDNIPHQAIMQPIRYEKTVDVVTTTTTKKKETTVDTQVYYYYKVYLAHHSIEPSEDIILYDAYGTEVMRVLAHDSHMNYAAGTYIVPGNQINSTVESIATATYWVFYSTSNLIIDYDNAIFKIHRTLLPFPDQSDVRATFEYIHTMTPIQGITKVIDGRWDTQVQTTFYAEPPSGYNYGILDLGQIQPIQAIDIVAGFFKPDDILKFDIDMIISLHYSLDNINYYLISDKTANLHFTGGSSVSLEEDALGTDFEARYLKIVIENVKRIEYKKGVWPVAFTEISAYSNIILKSEAKLIPTTLLVNDTLEQTGYQDIDAVSTKMFYDPESGMTETAFIGEDEFSYTGLDSTHFFNCLDLTEPHSRADYIVQYLENDTDIYDPDFLLQKLGDRLYKNVNIKEGFMYTQEELDRIAKAYLREFYKNHTKIQTEVMFSPHLLVGDTVRVVDTVNGIDDLYFVDSISDNNGLTYSLTLAQYPA